MIHNNKFCSEKDKTLMFDFGEEKRKAVDIKVIGVGGGGGNAINRMIEENLGGVDFITMNTDLQALENNLSSNIVQLGKKLTQGLGTGGDPVIGKKAIEESKDEVIEKLADANMIFITCGMGGGTGTGASPEVATIARDLGALTVGIVTKPFGFEGLQRMDKALKGIEQLKENVDTLIVVPNQKLLELVSKQTSLTDAFKVADGVLFHATKGISDLINKPGLVNLDFADVKSIMQEMGDALMSSGSSTNEEQRGREAAEEAISSPLIEDDSIKGAKGTIINITGGEDLNVNDINEATSVVYNEVGPESRIIWGAVIDQELKGEVNVTVIATGLNHDKLDNDYNKDELYRKERNISKARKNDIPIFQQIESDPLEQAMGDSLGNDGGIDLSHPDE
ncbi:MAG: cell division protein FtsZ [bacterium]